MNTQTTITTDISFTTVQIRVHEESPTEATINPLGRREDCYSPYSQNQDYKPLNGGGEKSHREREPIHWRSLWAEKGENRAILFHHIHTLTPPYSMSTRTSHAYTHTHAVGYKSHRAWSLPRKRKREELDPVSPHTYTLTTRWGQVQLIHVKWSFTSFISCPSNTPF